MKKMTFLTIIEILLFYILFPSNALGKSFTTSDIEKLAKQYVEQQYLSIENDEQKISISQPKLDPRIHISDCDSSLSINILENHNSRNINVKISCELPNTWQIYLPMKINIMQPVLVAAGNLNKGTILDASNTKINFIDSYKIRGAILTNSTKIIGAKLKRNIQKNSAIYTSNICVICKGDPVSIIANSNTFQIKTNGTALANGTVGEQIRIKNNRSGKIVTAQVKTTNKVVINL